MLKSFADNDTEKLWHGEKNRIPANIRHASMRKLFILNAAIKVEDMLVPKGNRLEKLKGKRKEQYSIRVNSQYRICFSFKDGDAYDVEITDYH